MKRTVLLMGLLVLLALAGCSKFGGAREGSEAAARAYLAAEFDKWIAGQESEAKTLSSRMRGLLAPLGYEFRSVVPDKPDFLANDKTEDLPDDWKSWPAYRFNVYIEWKSQAGTPLEKATSDILWSSHENLSHRTREIVRNRIYARAVV